MNPDDFKNPDSILPTGEEGFHHGEADVTLVGDGEAARIRAMDPGVRKSNGETIVLIGDKVAIRPDPPKRRTEGGLHIPDRALSVVHNTGELVKHSDQYHVGTVVAVGLGRRSDYDGARIPLDVEIGDRVRYHRASSSGMVWDDGGIAVLTHCDGGELIGDAIAWVEVDSDGVADAKARAE